MYKLFFENAEEICEYRAPRWVLNRESSLPQIRNLVNNLSLLPEDSLGFNVPLVDIGKPIGRTNDSW